MAVDLRFVVNVDATATVAKTVVEEIQGFTELREGRLDKVFIVLRLWTVVEVSAFARAVLG